MYRLFFRVAVIVVAALVGLGIGWAVGAVGAFRHASSKSANYPFLAEYFPLPHHVPEHKGGVSFRFAMAHDVIHERFPKHGPAHYRERNRLTRERLAKLPPDDPATFPLLDDLGAGLDRLGQAKEAAVILRDKLARQKTAGLNGRELYTSYANLGTFLSHDSLSKAIAGDDDARKRFREGVELVRKSVEVNPEAHFGRERWQVVIGEFLLAAMEEPDLLKTFDFMGNRLDLGIEEILSRKGVWGRKSYGGATNGRFNPSDLGETVSAFLERGDLDDPSHWAEVQLIRQSITRVGAEDGWKTVAVPSHQEPAPFDEPVLGIIGIWRQGSGANPHFALALGETMLRVGQRYIAWAAYERAARMADRIWPDTAIRQFLRDHCRKRQAQIEETLSSPVPLSDHPPGLQLSPPPGPEAVAGLRPQFEAELAHGEGYQRAYQEYEAKKIAAGVPITDERFFDEFHSGREPIASPVGPEDSYAYVTQTNINQYAARAARPVGWAWGVFGAGLAAMATALLFRWKDRRAAGRLG